MAGMLSKQDQQIEILGAHTTILQQHTDVLLQMLKLQQESNTDIKALRTDVQDLSALLRGEVIKRIEKLEETVFRKGA